MERWWYVAPLLVSLLGCPKPHPQPPAPTPTPEPAPIPTPTPEPTPTPTPTPITCTLPLDGQPVMKFYRLYPRVMDSTPLITNAERCRSVGFGDRVSCPTAPDDNPQRHVCECALIGGDCVPAYELVRDTGDLKWDYELDADGSKWKARVFGLGTGRMRSCYPNMKACSPWLELSFTE